MRARRAAKRPSPSLVAVAPAEAAAPSRERTLDPDAKLADTIHDLVKDIEGNLFDVDIGLVRLAEIFSKVFDLDPAMRTRLREAIPEFKENSDFDEAIFQIQDAATWIRWDIAKLWHAQRRCLDEKRDARVVPIDVKR